MSRSTLLLVTILILSPAIFLAGCASAGSRMVRAVSPEGRPSRHLLFNPERTSAAPCDVVRSDWPSTFVAERHSEEMTFQETVIDRQGRFGREQDSYYRRVRAVRTGRLIR